MTQTVPREDQTVLYTLLELAEVYLLPRCTPDYLALHASGVALLQAYFWAFHHGSHNHDHQQEEEQP